MAPDVAIQVANDVANETRELFRVVARPTAA